MVRSIPTVPFFPCISERFGAALADTFPALKEMLESLLLLNAKTDKIQSGVESAIAKLDRIVEAVDPSNPADRCPDFACALIDGAWRKMLEKFRSKGGRLPVNNLLLADSMKRVIHSKSAGRLDTIDFLIDHDFPTEVKLSPSVMDQADMTREGASLMTKAWQAADLSRNPT